MKKVKVFIVAFITFSTVLLSGCTSNNTLKENTVQISILSTERIHRLRTDNGYFFPEESNGFFIVEINVTNIGDNEEYTSLGYTTLSDTAGNKYRPAVYSYALSDYFNALSIQPNNFNRGKILFEVPLNCTVAHFYYNDLHNNISLQISEPELDIPTQIMSNEEIFKEFNKTVDEIGKIYFDISSEINKSLQGNQTNYSLVVYLGGDIVYLSAHYSQDILPLLPITTEHEEARKEFNASLLHWGQMGLYYIYYGYNQDMVYYNQTITQKNIADEHWVNCTKVLGFT